MTEWMGICIFLGEENRTAIGLPAKSAQNGKEGVGVKSNLTSTPNLEVGGQTSSPSPRSRKRYSPNPHIKSNELFMCFRFFVCVFCFNADLSSF